MYSCDPAHFRQAGYCLVFSSWQILFLEEEHAGCAHPVYISIAENSIFHVAGEKNQFFSLISLEEYKD